MPTPPLWGVEQASCPPPHGFSPDVAVPKWTVEIKHASAQLVVVNLDHAAIATMANRSQEDLQFMVEQKVSPFLP
jgi:hypothetical protein